MKNLLWAVLAGALLSGLVTLCCAPAMAGAGLPAAVETVPAGPGGLRYALVQGPCVQNRCEARIQLRSAIRVLDSVALAFAASDAAFVREPASEAGPVGWRAGSEEGAVTTTLRPVRLTAAPRARNALLVDQMGGFEHVKRRHDLFAHDGTRLRRLWSAAEGQGPAWSMTAVVPAGRGARDEIVVLEGWRPGGAATDRLSARRLVWDDARQTLVQRPQARLPALVAGSFASAAAARRVAEARPCLAGYWVLPAERFGGRHGWAVLAAVAADPKSIEAERAHPCRAVERRTATFRAFQALTKE